MNRAPYRSEIVGFERRHELDYRWRVERFEMVPEGTTGAPRVPAYGYRWIETLAAAPGT
ncbi:hypothetical protein [Candidatus Palauibacter sp.]|uniref:hypothetical protein n=1 Tax=Candidatus Palauibacter sp. TaxID=3101350 RepID=UPI003AF27B29